MVDQHNSRDIIVVAIDVMFSTVKVLVTKVESVVHMHTQIERLILYILFVGTQKCKT